MGMTRVPGAVRLTPPPGGGGGVPAGVVESGAIAPGAQEVAAANMAILSGGAGASTLGSGVVTTVQGTESTQPIDLSSVRVEELGRGISQPDGSVQKGGGSPNESGVSVTEPLTGDEPTSGLEPGLDIPPVLPDASDRPNPWEAGVGGTQQAEDAAANRGAANGGAPNAGGTRIIHPPTGPSLPSSQAAVARPWMSEPGGYTVMDRVGGTREGFAGLRDRFDANRGVLEQQKDNAFLRLQNLAGQFAAPWMPTGASAYSQGLGPDAAGLTDEVRAARQASNALEQQRAWTDALRQRFNAVAGLPAATLAGVERDTLNQELLGIHRANPDPKRPVGVRALLGESIVPYIQGVNAIADTNKSTLEKWLSENKPNFAGNQQETATQQATAALEGARNALGAFDVYRPAATRTPLDISWVREGEARLTNMGYGDVVRYLSQPDWQLIQYLSKNDQGALRRYLDSIQAWISAGKNPNLPKPTMS